MSKNHFTLTPIDGNNTKINIVGRNKLFANGVLHPTNNQDRLNVMITSYDYSANYLKSKIRNYLKNEEGITSEIDFNLIQLNDPDYTLIFRTDGREYEPDKEYFFRAGEKENHFVENILKCQPEALDYDVGVYFLQTTYKYCRSRRVDFNVFEIR